MTERLPHHSPTRSGWGNYKGAPFLDIWNWLTLTPKSLYKVQRFLDFSPILPNVELNSAQIQYNQILDYSLGVLAD